MSTCDPQECAFATGDHQHGGEAGLTKREYFAGIALQAVISATADRGVAEHMSNGIKAGSIEAKAAVAWADALIAALNEKP